MKLFARYLKYRAKIIITCIAVAGIFASSYFLFDMQAIAVLYPVLLTLCFGLIAAGFDFAAFALTLFKFPEKMSARFVKISKVLSGFILDGINLSTIFVIGIICLCN